MGVLADSSRGFNLATPSSSASYRECFPNRACQEGRQPWLSLIGFRKSTCACPCIIAPMVLPSASSIYRELFDPLDR